jgi:hypothetical protein
VGYRRRIESVGIDAIAAAARDHLHVDDAAIVLVGDADAFGADLEAAGLGRIDIERDEPTVAAGPLDAVAEPGPTDDEPETGPTAGAEEPRIPGIDDVPSDPGTGDEIERPDPG